MTTQEPNELPAAAPANGASRPSDLRRPGMLAGIAGLAILAAGVGAGATGYGYFHKDRVSFDTSMKPTTVADLANGHTSEIRGKVVEIFGNKFVLDDGSGRALVETGRAGEGGKLVAADETVTVQGRFEKGFLHAGALQRADGSVEELAPPPPAPPGGPRP